MELLPIIYFSLAAFSIIAVIIVIISYISFKFRQKYGNVDDGEILVELKPSTVSPARKALEAKRKAKKHRDSSRKRYKVKSVSEEKSRKSSSHHKSTKSRIEILNPIKITDSDDSFKKKKKTLTLEEDILKHYSNEDEDNFYTISGTKSD